MEELENNLPENEIPQEPVIETAEPEVTETVDCCAEEPVITEPDIPQEEEPATGQASPYADSPYVSYYDRTGHPTQAKKPRKKASSFGKAVLCTVLVLALVVGSCCGTATLLNGYWQNRMQETTDGLYQQIRELEVRISGISGSFSGSAASGEGMTPGQVYALNVDAVVAIACEVTTSGFFGYSTGVSTGSGFLISDDGYVLTNAHVVDGASAIEVMTHSEETYVAQVVGADSINDVALLKIDAADMPHVTLGSSSSLAVGDQVAAIGNPLGTLTSTLTVGYVSAKDRIVTTDGSAINMLQTDAAINSGNSGGPLFNMYGEVVGITTAKYSGTSSSGATIEGIGFAIPIDDIQGILTDLKDQGYVSSAYLGVTVVDVPTSAQEYGLPAGASVRDIEPGYAADKAQLQSNDIITKIGEYDITSTSDLLLALRKFKPGDTTTVTVYRSGTALEIDITLDEKPQQ